MIFKYSLWSAKRDVLRWGIAVAYSLLMVQISMAEEPPAAPVGDDYTAISLRDYQTSLLKPHDGNYRDMPLETKAAFFEWALWRYHLTSYNQVQTQVTLSERPGIRPVPHVGSDTSTWNGALLAGLSHKYAVTKDRQTRARILQLLSGLRFYAAVTGKSGHYARSIVPAKNVTPENLAAGAQECQVSARGDPRKRWRGVCLDRQSGQGNVQPTGDRLRHAVDVRLRRLT